MKYDVLKTKAMLTPLINQKPMPFKKDATTIYATVSLGLGHWLYHDEAGMLFDSVPNPGHNDVMRVSALSAYISGKTYADYEDDNGKLYGLGGNDALSGRSGNDEIDGGDGDDLIAGGKGSDKLMGGSGNDFISSSSEMNDYSLQRTPANPTLRMLDMLNDEVDYYKDGYYWAGGLKFLLVKDKPYWSAPNGEEVWIQGTTGGIYFTISTSPTRNIHAPRGTECLKKRMNRARWRGLFLNTVQRISAKINLLDTVSSTVRRHYCQHHEYHHQHNQNQNHFRHCALDAQSRVNTRVGQCKMQNFIHQINHTKQGACNA